MGECSRPPMGPADTTVGAWRCDSPPPPGMSGLQRPFTWPVRRLTLKEYPASVPRSHKEAHRRWSPQHRGTPAGGADREPGGAPAGPPRLPSEATPEADPAHEPGHGLRAHATSRSDRECSQAPDSAAARRHPRHGRRSGAALSSKPRYRRIPDVSGQAPTVAARARVFSCRYLYTADRLRRSVAPDRRPAPAPSLSEEVA
jgi:hypothetical protein